ncbi:metallophosphoesterase [Aerophototrophica crusticola]|uniref:Metallophosphoesterase n=1 Tax=Aerophototrophica crusticola TaxID=1709002 RepID=A0A858R5K3_9PROT|nr:metallophosphoesterase [Rhodospirillaceae bacterium B3]
MVAFRFAHLSDPHLPLVPGETKASHLFSKRALGFLSWQRKRRRIHSPAMLARLVEDVRAAAPDHVAVTGDLANIAMAGEFARGRDWLRSLGNAEAVTVIPGNHDTLVPFPWDEGLGLWTPWMAADPGQEGEGPFPAVRVRGPVAFVCLNSGLPTPPLLATGRLGPAQIRAARDRLESLGRQGLFRVVLVHHPVASGVISPRKALSDQQDFRAMLAGVGAELVLHGHAHRSCFSTVPGPSGPIPCLGVPSASSAPSRRRADSHKDEPARWHLLSVARTAEGWRLTVTARGPKASDGGFGTLGEYVMDLPAAAALPSALSSAA